VNTSATLPEMIDGEYDPTDTRQLLVLLYRRRLARLLTLEPAGGYALIAREERQLRSRAVLATIRALTDLGDGEAASAILRRAQRR
jgi:hypothetical protein